MKSGGQKATSTFVGANWSAMVATYDSRGLRFDSVATGYLW